MICRPLIHLALFTLTAFPLQAGEQLTLPLPDGGGSPRQPQAAVAGPDLVHVAFGAGTAIYCTTSRNRGSRFSSAVKIADVPSLMLGARRGPRIAAIDEQAVVTAIGQGGELLSWRSVDGGRNWRGPEKVSDAPRAAREGLHALAAGPRGELYCVWLDLRDGGPQVYGSGSTDGGATWNSNQLLYRSPEGNVCECCHPSVAIDKSGSIYVTWRNWLDGNRDLYVIRSADSGRSFSAPKRLGSGHWRIDHCPMDGGAIAISHSGKMATVWRRDKEILATLPGHNAEVSFGRGEQPWLACDERGTWITWLAPRGGQLSLQHPGTGRPEVISQHAADPMIAASVFGKSPVVLVWEEGENRSMKALRVQVFQPE